MDECDFDEACKVFGGFLEPRKDAAGLFKPADQAFYDVPPPIRFAIEFHWPGVAIFILLGGNYWLDLSIEQVLVNPISAVSFVPAQRYRPSDGFPFPIM